MKERRLSEYLLKKIILHFCVDIEASKTAILLGLNRNTINSYYNDFRIIIAQHQAKMISHLPIANNKILQDPFQLRFLMEKNSKKIIKQLKSYPVYGVFEYNGNVFTEVISQGQLNIYHGVVDESNSTENSHSSILQRNYQALLYGMFPTMVFPPAPENKDIALAPDPSFIIESFWSFSCRRLQKFNGISRHFYLHLKECEWRWKQEQSAMTKQLLKLVKSSG